MRRLSCVEIRIRLWVHYDIPTTGARNGRDYHVWHRKLKINAYPYDGIIEFDRFRYERILIETGKARYDPDRTYPISRAFHPVF